MRENDKGGIINQGGAGTEGIKISKLSMSTTKMDPQDQQNSETKLEDFIGFLNSSDQKLEYDGIDGETQEISGQEFLNKYIKDLFHYAEAENFEFHHKPLEDDSSMKNLILNDAWSLNNIDDLLRSGLDITGIIEYIEQFKDNLTDPIFRAFMDKYQDVINMAWNENEKKLVERKLILSNEAIDAIFSNFNYNVEQTRKIFNEEHPDQKFQIEPKLEDISAFETNVDTLGLENVNLDEGFTENNDEKKINRYFITSDNRDDNNKKMELDDKSNQEKKSPIWLSSRNTFIEVCKIIARLIKNQALLAQQKKQNVTISQAWVEINKIESVKQAFSTIVSNYGETIEKYFENIDRIECKYDIEFNILKWWLDKGRCKFTVKDGRLDLIPDEKKLSAFERLNWNFDKLMLAMEENKLLAFSLSLGLLSSISTVVFALNIWLEFAKFALVSTAATAASVAVPAVVLVVCIVAIYYSKNRQKPPKEGSETEKKVPFGKEDEIYKDKNSNKEDLSQNLSSSLPKIEDSEYVNDVNDDYKNENDNNNDEDTKKNIGDNIGGNSDNKENNEESENNNLDNKEKPKEEGKNYEKEEEEEEKEEEKEYGDI